MRDLAHPLLDALLMQGVDPDVLDLAARESERTGKSLRSVLVKNRVVTETELTEASAYAFGMDSIDLEAYPIDPAAMARIPLPLVERHLVLGLAVTDRDITVAITDPGDVVALDDVRAATGLTVRPVMVDRRELRKIVDKLRRERSHLEEIADAGHVEPVATVSDLGSGGEDALTVRYVNTLLEQAIRNRASDLHMEPSEKDMRVRYRIDGVLHEIDVVPRAVQSALVARLKVMSNLDITERRQPQNGRITAKVGEHTVDLRTATLPTVWGEKVVLRVLDTKHTDFELNKLAFSELNLHRFRASFRKPHGMVLVTGPTGSGKSTTLYATLHEVSGPSVNIITVEDPVEYRMAGVNQVQVDPKAGLTFGSVLPAILRSDPDVVLIGEIRDRTTAQIAVEAALTGHLVLSTLHTNSAPSAVTRLVEMGIEPFLVGSSLDCVLAQRLARRLCDWCKKSYAPSPSDLNSVHWPWEMLGKPGTLWKQKGCRECAYTGYRGRLALHEVMPVTEEIERLALQRGTAKDIYRVALAEGMVDLRVDGLAKALAGHTSLDEILRVTV
ncbi:GspE/PulE family protein [Luedemannella flava]|uniref:GspE/PulE family protein n=1 Tax=Luedemannella flava TaxID=349316 RepID=A0ABN2ME50_9ACTN